tara:strand:+ start:598 stop:1068 length:471 start_codon:yes stop_codon:yes gene_type:complete
MTHITIITLGKLKENYWKAAEKEYLKRLSIYSKISIIELKEISFSHTSQTNSIRKKEAEELQKHIPKNATVIALHEEGKTRTSKTFADFLKKQTTHGQHIVFVIGGPLGLDRNFLNTTTHQLSLSSLTFPHQMVRTILLEQIYRAHTIISGKQYHY